ncbi:MAG: hypothetical protein HFI34_11875 [Lachnospiraceae bacterium]|nr:hypothetical protein [Lachnospiraceae bacterium]
MLKRKPIVILPFIVIIILILLIGYLVLKPEKKKMDLQSGDIGCVLVRKNSTSVMIEDKEEIEEIIALLNKLEYQQEHPYTRLWNSIINGNRSAKKTYYIAFFKDKGRQYVFNDGWRKVSLDRNGEEIQVDSVDYKLRENRETEYKEYFDGLVKKYLNKTVKE